MRLRPAGQSHLNERQHIVAVQISDHGHGGTCPMNLLTVEKSHFAKALAIIVVCVSAISQGSAQTSEYGRDVMEQYEREKSHCISSGGVWQGTGCSYPNGQNSQGPSNTDPVGEAFGLIILELWRQNQMNKQREKEKYSKFVSNFVQNRVTDPSFHGYWQGTYRCAQGLTGLTLSIFDVGDGKTGSMFHFYPVQSNPNVPEGCYFMTVSYNRSTTKLIGNPYQWVERPQGYRMVGIDANILSAQGKLIGEVSGAPMCTIVRLEKTNNPRLSSGKCRIGR